MRDNNLVIAPKDLARLERLISKVCSRCESILQRMDEKLAIRQRKIESDLEKELSKLNLLEFV